MLEGLQGSQSLSRESDGVMALMPTNKGMLSQAEYDQLVRDLVNYLAYTTEPKQQVRSELGLWVIGFLSVFTILSLLLKKEYWRDVH
ncbi:hypothetical protein LDJ79_19165 [Vibrio tritonius]|uniref:Cytochrome c1 n=1 Tax=Vibrio tritonius TaxID=1435069 RepID=A0ABS7YVJ4_9VIBR|nr:cytochrome c1 [Vibrio tritonius]MCA2018249.1 hypothetical protein [Vibrio tritonius]